MITWKDGCYVTQALCVSEGAAACRIQVAGVCRRFPQILQALASGEINLTVASRVSPVLTEENCDYLLRKCRKMSSRDVLALLIDLKLRREPVAKPSLRKASTFAEKGAVGGDDSGTAPVKSTGNSTKELRRNIDVSAVGPASPEKNCFQPKDTDMALAAEPLLLFRESGATPDVDPDNQSIAPLVAARYNLKLSISAELKDKIDRLAEVMGLANAVTHMEKIIEQAVDDALARRDPICKEERRLSREQRARPNVTAMAEDASTTSRGAMSLPSGQTQRNRAHKLHDAGAVKGREGYVAAQVRATALKRAAYRCEFISADGERCRARHDLEIDHILPKARGGTGEAGNLQVLCRAHNLRKAEHDLGEAFMRGIVAGKRPAAAVSQP